MSAPVKQVQTSGASIVEGLIGSSWVAPTRAPEAIAARDSESAGLHSDSLTHGDGGEHVDAHGDHGDR